LVITAEKRVSTSLAAGEVGSWRHAAFVSNAECAIQQVSSV
jgi:hypothetical protein